MARILLADDDQATRDLVKRALEAEGHSVDVTQDGLEALDKVKSSAEPFALLVSDVHMPGIDGVSLARQAVETSPALRVLFMSGFPEELERAKSVAASRLDVITKPFTLEQVRAAVRALLG